MVEQEKAVSRGDILEVVRVRMLAGALPYVADEGWERAFMRAQAKEDPDVGRLAFAGRVDEMVLFFFTKGDRCMSELLVEMNLDGMRIQDRIRTAVKTRLEIDLENREAVRRGVAFLSLPGNVGLGVGSLYACADGIWRVIGDRSVDHNFFSKRGILTLVLGATTLFWLDDKSEGCEATWRFLDRRIENVVGFESVKRQLPNLCGGMESFFGILGRFRYPG